MLRPKRFPVVPRWYANGDHPRDYEKDIVEPDGKTIIYGEDQRARGWEGQVVRRFRNPYIRGNEMCQECTHDFDEHGWLDIPPINDFDMSTMICPGTTIRFIDEYLESVEVYRKSQEKSNEL